ncbi:MAG TPA: IS481 family transposase [Desulfobacteria bacterium]|nr:IS481 family transposase [Desulfobacteria bacterium]
MPWKETYVLDLRKEFVHRALTERTTFTDLCAEYGISTKTGYKWKERFLSHGYGGLEDHSRRPNSCPSQLNEDAVIRIMQLKLAHISWGPKKIQTLYENIYRKTPVPSISSIQRVLDKAGLVRKKRVRRAQPNQSALRQRIEAVKPNDVWTVDFKGWWFTNLREKCIPLTIRDQNSRFLLDIRLMQTCTTNSVKQVFINSFEKYGLPRYIRSDNGSPFAAHNSILGLSSLSAWWLTLGIIPDRIEPGKPYQNGGHERMHRDMKFELQGKISGGLNAHQRAIDVWRDEFNNVRPHEALGMKTPAEVYNRSDIKYEGDSEELIYPFGYFSRKVSSNGNIKLNNSIIQISSALSGYHLGLNNRDDSSLNVWINDFLLGEIDLRTYSFNSISEEVLTSS